MSDKTTKPRTRRSSRPVSAPNAAGVPPVSAGEIRLPIGYQTRTSAAVGELRLPLLSDVDARQWIIDALDSAVTNRKGHVIMGAKGTGKSMAVAEALQGFAALEDAQKKADPKYQQRLVVHVRNLRARTYRDAVVFLWQRLTGAPARTRMKGRVRTDDELMSALVTQLLAMNVAALMVDEAEHLSRAALAVLRDVMSISETSAPERISGAGYAPRGVGMVLVGTPRLQVALAEHDEAGQRFASIRHVDGCAPERLGAVYRSMLPAFEAAATDMGTAAWERLIGEVVARGAENVPLRAVENHIRQYAHRMNQLDPGSGGSSATIAWNEEVFRYTASELLLG